MSLRTAYVSVLSALLGLGLSAHAAEPRAADQAADRACAYSVTAAPKAVQDTLSPAYAEPSKIDLKGVAKRMNTLMLEIGHCQALAQNHDNVDTDAEKHHAIAEWISLNQWLYRLTMFVDQNARGDLHMDWRREFETFIDVYQLKR